MATPKGTRALHVPTQAGDAVHIYSKAATIVLQLRRDIPTEADPSAVSFKVSVSLSPAEALKIAGELLTVAGGALSPKQAQASQLHQSA
jgi:hypothetical protein